MMWFSHGHRPVTVTLEIDGYSFLFTDRVSLELLLHHRRCLALIRGGSRNEIMWLSTESLAFNEELQPVASSWYRVQIQVG